MIAPGSHSPRQYKVYLRRDLDKLPQLQKLPADERLAMQAVASVMPFRVNNYVVDELIDWDNVPADPMYQLTFPQRGMLDPTDLDRLMGLLERDAPTPEVQTAVREIQQHLNPHPAGQLDMNVPRQDGAGLEGMQHKYRETVLFFPSQGQTCHAYCSYCFRWPQFAGLEGLKFAARESAQLVSYLREHKEVTSVLITGGDPLVMKTSVLRRYIEPLLEEPGLEHVTSIRLGTKAPAYWPYRFTTDKDADDLLRLFEDIERAGKHLAVMVHYSHSRELMPPVAEEALRRIRGTGAVVRCQAPLIRHVNDNANAWRELWRRQVELGAVPYYMFVERDTGPRHYFEVPLARALDIFQRSYRYISGLARTVRGPSMSATPGKVLVDGVTEIQGERVFVLKFLQARNPSWVNQVFFARFDPHATWLDDLVPAFGEPEFFFAEGLRELEQGGRRRAWSTPRGAASEVSAWSRGDWD